MASPRKSRWLSLEELVDWLKVNGSHHVEVAKGYTVEDLTSDLDKIESERQTVDYD